MDSIPAAKTRTDRRGASCLDPLPYRETRLGEGVWKERFRVNRDYLLSLEVDAYLEAFYRAYAPPGTDAQEKTCPGTLPDTDVIMNDGSVSKAMP